jgi:hypothetical protein
LYQSQQPLTPVRLLLLSYVYVLTGLVHPALAEGLKPVIRSS